ncbi:MAG: ATP-binding protein [Planctomycetota bacterium]|nr:ATP-binding protein [Planctomycetota bacterium]
MNSKVGEAHHESCYLLTEAPCKEALMFVPTQDAMSWCLQRAIPSDLDVGHEQIESLMTELEKASWDGRDLFHVRMAVEEAVVNSIEHGNKRDTSKIVQLDFRVSPELCYIDIIDQGEGFDPDALRDCTDEEFVDKPRGRGVMLIKELMSEAVYNEKGNRLTMIRKRNDPAFEIRDEG